VKITIGKLAELMSVPQASEINLPSFDGGPGHFLLPQASDINPLACDFPSI
jgi:hypothetical protein